MLSIIVHPIVIYYVLLLLMTSYLYGSSPAFLRILKKFQYNVCHTKVLVTLYTCNILYVVSVHTSVYMHVIFCSLSGLNHSLVQRLKPTWEKVPGKYHKMKKVRN